MSENNKKYVVKSVAMSEMVQPKLVEQKIKDSNFVLNGDKHKYVKFLNELYTKSDTHRSMIVTKANLTAGHNIKFEGDLFLKDEVKLQEWFENINDENDTLHEVISNAALDYWIFGYCFLQIIWTKGKTIYSIEHIDASTIASGKVNAKGKVDTYYYSNDWSKYWQEENKPIEIPAFNPDNIQIGKPQLYMIRKKEPGLVYYANAPYGQTTIMYALQEFDMASFHLNNTNNAFFPSALVTHTEPGLTEEQEDDIIENFEALYTGTKQKKIVHMFIGDKEMKPTVDSFQSNDDSEKFLELMKEARNMIVLGHMMNKNLIGIPNDGGVLGDRASIQDSFELILKNTIRPVQQMFEKAINKILQYKVEGAKIEIQTKSPLHFKGFSENILSQVLTQTEIRNELGYEPLQPGEATNLDTVRSANPDLNNGQAVYPNSIIEQDQANE